MMTIPFLDFFKGKLTKGQPVTTTEMPPPKMEKKQGGDRLSKTVMPNANRAVVPQESFQMKPAPISMTPPPAPAPIPAPISAPAPVAAPAVATAPAPTPKKPFSLGKPSGGPRPSDIPPAVALAIEPKVERVIAIELSEVAGSVPTGWMRPVSEAEGQRRILLKAAEVEKGMSSGKPSVSVASIYQQVPEFFVKPVPAGDGTQVPLPFEKVLKEFENVQQRKDQFAEQTVPQVETPFLKVTLEDDSKFGVKTGPVQIGEMPPVRLEPATAEAIAAANPEATAAERIVIKAPRALTPQKARPASAIPNANPPAPIAPPPAAPPPPAPAAPTRIPFKLSPTGPGAPASERVPASSGPSVPSAPPPAPARIPFKMGGAGKAVPEKETQWLTKDNFGEKAVAAASAPLPASTSPKDAGVQTGRKISLPLKAIFHDLPPFQLTDDIEKVPEDARIELPFALIEPQLAAGRVSLKPEQFAAALPEKFQGFFSAKEISAPVVLRLQDVLKNLPAESLHMRADQVEQETGEDFATPFSAKAAEDAKRFNLNPAPMAGPSAGPTPAESVSTPAAVTPQQLPALKMETAVAHDRTALQTALDTDDDIDAKAVVAYVDKMAGVKACAIMFGDGLSLAGNLPGEYGADGLCAMAPSLLQKIENHMSQTKLGALRAMTLSCSQAAVTFFMHDNLCLAALHSKEELAADIRERLARAVHELSKKYSQQV